MKRPSGRKYDELRKIEIDLGISKHAEGSCLIKFGDTHVLCTASVEEVIDGHYKDQTYKLGKDEEELKKKIMKFRQDELDHKDIAYDNGATKKGLFGVLDKVIKTSSRIAITISEKI